MKYFVISIDDGTIYDRKVIEILNRHHIKGTFNLNSGLEDFVWYNEGRPVKRLTLRDNVELYKGHEVASHSLTHPHLTNCSDDHIGYEVGVDKENLEHIFNREITSFAFPFEDFDERCINRIKAIDGFKTIRLSEIDNSFTFPIDPFHIKITSLDVNEALKEMSRFVEDKNAKLFVFVSHGYDFEFNDTYNKLEELCKYVNKHKIKSIFTSEIVELIKKNGFV